MSEGNTMTEEQVRAIVREELQRHERGLPVALSITSQANIDDLVVDRIRAVNQTIRDPRRR